MSDLKYAQQVLDDLREFPFGDKLKELQEYFDNIKKENERLTDHIRTLENKVEEMEDGQLATLKEIIEKAENWDYGLKGWRTLETKQDLINAIKKEVLEA